MDIEKLSPVHPGEILKLEFLEPLGISQNKLALTMRVPADRVNAIVNGKRGITADTALRLAIALNTSPEFWMNMQCHYDLQTARLDSESAVKREVIPLIQ
jgi:antitoxin HigA-1